MITSLHDRLNCGTNSTKIKMDVGINSVVQSLLNVDLGQFSDSLFALGDRRKTDTSDHEDLVEENSEDDTSVASLPKKCCAICGKLSQSPNIIASRRIKECVAQLKISGRAIFLRDDFVSSRNLEDYLQPSIWCWHPQRLLEPNAAHLVCWNVTCAGHFGTSYILLISYDKYWRHS